MYFFIVCSLLHRDLKFFIIYRGLRKLLFLQHKSYLLLFLLREDLWIVNCKLYIFLKIFKNLNNVVKKIPGGVSFITMSLYWTFIFFQYIKIPCYFYKQYCFVLFFHIFLWLINHLFWILFSLFVYLYSW